MRAYELMVIFDGDVDDAVVNENLAGVDPPGRGRRRHGRHDRPVGSAAVRLRDQPQVRRHLRRARDRDRGRDLDELERILRLADEVVRHKLIRLPDSEAARRGLLGEAAAGRGRVGERNLQWQTETPSPSSATSPATPSCASRRAGRPSPPSAWPSTAAGRTARPTSGKKRCRSSTSSAGPRWPRTWPSRCRRAPACIVTGRLEQRSWETQDGEKRSKVEVVADEIGPSLRWATAAVDQERAPRRRLRRRRRRWRRRRRRAAPPRQRAARRLRQRRGALLMAKAAAKRGKNKDNARRSKKKISILDTEKVEYVDYKDVNLLRRFMSDRAKIRARRVTGNDAQQQTEIARAIKNAREMALLPYANRVTTQRGGGRDRGDRGDRGDRARPPPRPRPTTAVLPAQSYAGRGADDRRPSRGRRGRRRGRRGRRRAPRPTRSDELMQAAPALRRRRRRQEGRHRRRRRRLRPQLPRAQGLRHQGDEGRRGPGRGHAPVARPQGRRRPVGGRGDRQGAGARGDHHHGQGRRRGQAVRLGHRGRRGRRRARPRPASSSTASASHSTSHQDGRHPHGAGQAPRRRAVPDHRRGRRPA